MTQSGYEHMPLPHERAFPFPEDQLEFEQQFTAAYLAQFPDAARLLDRAMAGLHRAAGFPDQTLHITGAIQDGALVAATDEELAFLNRMMRQPLSPTGCSALELTLGPQPGAPAPRTPQEQYQANVEHDWHVLEAAMPPETSALLRGIYGLIGTQVLRDDHQTGRQHGNVILRGTYLGQAIYIQEKFGHYSPLFLQQQGVEAQEAFMVYYVGEAEALRLLHQ